MRGRWTPTLLICLALGAGCGGGDQAANGKSGGAPGGDGASGAGWPADAAGEITVDLPKGETMVLVYVPPGEFMMGARTDEAGAASYEGPQHTVVLTKGFYLGKTEVTQAQWLSLMDVAPWRIVRKYARDNGEDAASYLSLKEARQFIDRLNGHAAGGGFRLPTEAEWEYACRAGTTTRFSFGDDPDHTAVDDYAWHKGNTWETGLKHPQPVAQKKPNPFGLFDMHGNVREWVSDTWKDRYPSEPQTDPAGPRPGAIPSQIARGGCFTQEARWARSAARGGPQSDSRRDMAIGLRVARDVPAP